MDLDELVGRESKQIIETMQTYQMIQKSQKLLKPRALAQHITTKDNLIELSKISDEKPQPPTIDLKNDCSLVIENMEPSQEATKLRAIEMVRESRCDARIEEVKPETNQD